MAAENIRHWRVGDVEIARIVEVNAFEDNISMLLKDETAENVRQHAWLRPHFATPEGLMKISFQAFVLRSRGKSVMIDTCIGADRKREYDVFCNLQTTFLTDLVTAGFPAESIDAVLCTHLRATGGYHHFGHLEDAVDPVVAAGLVDYITPDYHLTDEVSLFPTPGHTPGHVSVLIRSRDQEAVITGDLMHHPIQLIDPGREANFDMDKSQGAQTRQAFVDRFGGTSVLVIGSHFCDPTGGWIVRHGSGWKLVTV